MAKNRVQVRRVSLCLSTEQWELIDELARFLKLPDGPAASFFFHRLGGTPKTRTEVHEAVDALFRRETAERKRPRLSIVKH